MYSPWIQIADVSVVLGKDLSATIVSSVCYG